VATGVLDDLYNLKPLFKLAGQTAAAAIVVVGNMGHFNVLLDYFNQYHIPGFVTMLLITGWIVLMINAFNLIDGLDGLAAGTAVLILVSMAAISLYRGSLALLGFELLVLGAILGFLLFNFQPARIFMGDTGSMLLGFLLSLLYLFSLVEPVSASLILGSAFIFAYPALDVSFAIYRRLRRRGSILLADRGHIHHLLLRLGFSVRQTVAILYSVSIFFGAAAVLLICVSLPPAITLAVGAATAAGVFFLFRYLNRLGSMARKPPLPAGESLWSKLQDHTVANGKS
jgi:UDP-GlcNAc:undecaprenyl-phosphate/decaprenyl-phosphate GlcNAc-1-phosphate transferase